MSLAPAAVEILLHYYVTPLKYETDNFEADYIDYFVANGILQPRKGALKNDVGDEYDEFEITEKGKAHVMAICDLPFPVVQWVTPR